MEPRGIQFQPAGAQNPKPIETGQESVADPVTARLLSLLDRDVNRESRDSEQMSFTDELDEIEIQRPLDELEDKYSSGLHDFGSPSMAEEERQVVLAYHAGLVERKKLGEARGENFSKRSLSEFLHRTRELRKLLWDIDLDWDRSVFAFLRQREKQEGRFVHIEDEFGGTDISDVEQFFATPPEVREQLLLKYPELAEAYARFYIGQYPNLQLRLQEVEQSLDAQTRQHPEEVRNLLAKLHASDQEIDSSAMDDLIGIRPEKTERKVDTAGLEEQYGYEQFVYQGTPYEMIREFLKELNLSEDDVLYDLGCGYGRIPLYGAMTTSAQYRGIEIVPERVIKADEIKDKFKLDNVEFRQGNVLEQNYEDGTVFFLFNPFTDETLEAAGRQLEEISKTKKIRIVSLGASTRYFRSQDWLRPVETSRKEEPWGLTIYENYAAYFARQDSAL